MTYFAPPTAGAEPLPHVQYGQAVHQALVAAGAEPVEWYMDEADFGLRADYYYRPYRPEPRPDGTVPLTPDPEHWQHGLQLSWTERGWCYLPLDEGSDPLWDEEDAEPLPVPVLADPDAVAALLVLLLAGRFDEIGSATVEWSHAPVQRTAILEHARRAGRA
ncbi:MULTISPECIES: hypothetical protein [Streptomycetaceae]|uniref:hypothetical protein n=1 Tax=Streptomycetaceae TaxID=2062 RepID=UPI00093D27D1|nr:hypothetical protein [Streptomyces sp. CB02056]OKH97563.1 hypothetical protein AMK13_38375 [Streptomyces sp. CB02056]